MKQIRRVPENTTRWITGQREPGAMRNNGEGAIEVLVLMDGARNYYLIPREALEGSRATAEQQAALQRALAGDADAAALSAAGLGEGTLSPMRGLFAPVGVLALPASSLSAAGIPPSGDSTQRRRMQPMSTPSTEVLVLTDREGNYYIIPRAVLEQARASDAQRAAIEDALGGDTSGFQEPGKPSGGGGGGRPPEGPRPPKLEDFIQPVGMVTLANSYLSPITFTLGQPW